ncbi:MAG: J domain-containing protein [Lachnospiraceae bacterium]
MDYYQILGIDEQATEEQIKQAYRKLAKQYHPDLHPGDAKAEARFKDIVEAYEILGNSKKRKAYDEKRKKASEVRAKKTRTQTTAPEMGIQNFTKHMESYFGFAFSGAAESKKTNKENKQQGNPLDMTKMFEGFMGIR